MFLGRVTQCTVIFKSSISGSWNFVPKRHLTSSTRPVVFNLNQWNKQPDRRYFVTKSFLRNDRNPANTEFTLPDLEEAYNLMKQGKYHQCEMLFERSLEVCESVMGPSHPAALTIKKQLREVYTQLKRTTKLQKILEQLYRSQQDNYEKNYSDLFNLVKNLIVYSQLTDNMKSAIDVLTHFIKQQKKLPQNEEIIHDQVLSLTWLGSCYGAKFQLDGEKECAKVYFDTALQLAQSIPSNSLSLILARGNLARYFHEKKEYDRAEEQYRELIATIEKFTPSEQKEIENKEILQSELYVDLGELLRTKRDLEQADQMLKKGIDLIDKYYPKDSVVVRYVLQWIFLELVDQKQFFYAEGLYRRLLDLWEKIARPDQYQIESMLKYQEVLKKFYRENEANELAQKTQKAMAKKPININLFTFHLSFLNK